MAVCLCNYGKDSLPCKKNGDNCLRVDCRPLSTLKTVPQASQSCLTALSVLGACISGRLFCVHEVLLLRMIDTVVEHDMLLRL